MKMKEVCQKTGLTERTVRYYIERGLIHPLAAPSANGRTDYRFDNSHIARLRDIAVLREYGFPIDRILEMEENASSIGGHMENQARESRLLEASARQRKEILSRLCQTEFTGIAHLAGELRREGRTLSLPDPDVKTDFRRLDELEGSEGTADTAEDGEVLERILRRDDRKRKLLFAGIVFLLILALGAGLFLRRRGQSAATVFSSISSATFSEKWQEEGSFYARLLYGEGSELAGISCVVRFESYPLYWAIVPGHEYMSATICAEVPLREGRKEGIITEGEIPSVDILRLLQDEALSAKYAVVTAVQGE